MGTVSHTLRLRRALVERRDAVVSLGEALKAKQVTDDLLARLQSSDKELSEAIEELS
jgi:prefoldin subunit 5